MSQLRKSSVAATILLMLAGSVSLGLALNPAGLNYKGMTSQGRTISFAVSAGAIRGLQFNIVDRCKGKRTLFVWDHGFPSMLLYRSRFGGTFKNKAGSTVIIDGRMHGTKVRGSLSDRTRNNKTHRFCSGHARFKLRPA